MKTDLLSLTGSLPQYQITLLPDAEKLKAEALKKGKLITAVSSEEDHQLAAEAMVTIKGLIDGMEKTRKIVKDPVYKAGLAVDATARKYSTDLKSELDRIKELVGPYIQEQERKAAQAERERQEAIRKQREEEERIAALKREEERKAEEAKLAQGKEAERLAQEAAYLRAARIDAELEAMDEKFAESMQAVVPTKAAGTSSVKRYKVTVTDIHAVYAFNRLAVRLEPNLTVLQQMAQQGMTVPGVTFEEEVQIRVSGSAPAMTLR